MILLLFRFVVPAILICLFVYCWMLIFRKAGFDGWLGVLMAVPLLNALLFLYFAFTEWPVSKESCDR
ncbi:MAG: hypothetical protein AB1742_09890 [bacterium]